MTALALTLVAVLALVGQASADCGWVLWVKGWSAPDRDWAVMVAYDTHVECREAGRLVRLEVRPREVVMCLPAGTDPRPPGAR